MKIKIPIIIPKEKYVKRFEDGKRIYASNEIDLSNLSEEEIIKLVNKKEAKLIFENIIC